MKTVRKLIALTLGLYAVSTFGFDFFGLFGSTSFDIVKDGKPVAEIVLAREANQSEKLAAADLVEFFEKMSGAKVAVVPAPSGEFENVIYVGESEFTNQLGFDLEGVEDGGYKIVVKDHYAIVAGRDQLLKLTQYNKTHGSDPVHDKNALRKWEELAGEKFTKNNLCPTTWWYRKLHKNPISPTDDTGTWYAASDLLQQLGVRFYAPYESGTVVPSEQNLSLKTQDLVRSPHALVRDFHGHPSFETVKWYKRMGCGNSVRIVSSHTTDDIMTEDVIAKHPSIQARDKDGEAIGNYRDLPIPKFADPVFLKLSLKYLDAMFKAYPECGADLYACGLGPPDGMGKTDHHDRLKFPEGVKKIPGMAYANDRDSNYLWDYWNRAAKGLKKTHPDKKLACFAYGTYVEPPQDTSLVSDNTVIHHVYSGQVMTEGNFFHKAFLETQAAWLNLVGPKRYYVWNHYLFYWRNPTPYPHFFTEAMRDDAQRSKGFLGKFIEVSHKIVKNSEGKKEQRLLNPGLMHFTLYWQSVLFWNPDADREKVMNEYFRLYFGPAEEEMKAFYCLAEKRTNEERLPLNKYTEKMLTDYHDGYFSLLKAARAKCEKNSVYDRRIAMIENEMAPLKLIPPTLKRDGPRIYRGMVKKSVVDADYQGFHARPMKMKVNKTGESVSKNSTNVKIGLPRDQKTLYVIAECVDDDMKEISANCMKDNDKSIFSDDVVEIYVATPERCFFKIAVNSNGAVWAESTDPEIIQRDTLPILWEPGVKTKVKKWEDRWVVEVAIPTIDFGKLGPSKEFPWWIQVARTRIRRGEQAHQAVAPTGGAYAKIAKWGRME